METDCQTCNYTKLRMNSLGGAFDTNDDNFSELPEIKNNSFGINSFFQIDEDQKIEANFSNTYEYRYSGEMIDGPAYLTKQSEERTHNVIMGGIDYTYNPTMRTGFVLYSASQYTQRDHFTGISPDGGQELQDYNNAPSYGDSKNSTYHDDFDKGKKRDSGYVYGQAKPRSVFFGIKLFN